MIWITYLVLVFFPILVTWFVAFLDAQKQSWSVTSFSLATGVGCWPWLALGFNMFRTLPGSKHFCVTVDLGDQDRNPAVKLTSLAWLEDVWGGSLGC